MKSRFVLAGLFLASLTPALFAQDTRPLLHEKPLPVIAEPSFKEPLDATWFIAKGKWVPEGGVLTTTEIPADKHVPVLHHKTGLESAVIECEFMIEGPGPFYVGCDSNKHIGRVVITAAGISIAEDSVKPSHTLATVKTPVKAGEWHQLRVEWKGDHMAARLDGHEVRAQHAFFATKKVRSWFAAAKTAKIRGLKISGVKQ